MTIADPKKYARTKDQAEESDEGLTLQERLDALQEQVAALLASKASTQNDDLEKILLSVAQMSADAHERAANPSNKTHPGISVFSHPEGDRARPRTPFKCEMFWVGYPLDLDTTTVEEIELLNLAEPGTYSFKRSDRSTETLTITGERAPDGRIEKLLFTFPVRENRETLPSMEDMLRSAFGVKTPEQRELDELRAAVARLTPQSVGA